MSRDLAVRGQMLVGLRWHPKVAQGDHVFSSHAGDAQDVDHCERTQPATDGHERHVVDRNSMCGQVMI